MYIYVHMQTYTYVYIHSLRFSLFMVCLFWLCPAFSHTHHTYIHTYTHMYTVNGPSWFMVCLFWLWLAFPFLLEPVRVCMYVCVYIYMHVCVNMYVFMYVYELIHISYRNMYVPAHSYIVNILCICFLTNTHTHLRCINGQIHIIHIHTYRDI